jgi:hypothetical protein
VRILVDQNVNEDYTETLRRAEWLTVAVVREELAADADDEDISPYAAEHGWVIFTADDDFFTHVGSHAHGLLFYHQTENPAEGDVLDAVWNIAQAYTDHSEIIETVPNGWLDEK